MPEFLTVGDPAPWFTAPSTSNPAFHFDTVGGYRVILSFLGSSKNAASKQVLQRFCAIQDQLEMHQVVFFGVTADSEDTYLKDLVKNSTYFKLIWDFKREVSALYGACRARPASEEEAFLYSPVTFVLDQNLTVVGVFPIQDEEHVESVFAFAKALPTFGSPTLAARQAPVLLIPNVLSREFCQQLIKRYEADGGTDSGFMRQVDGKTVEVLDYGFKKRRDLLLEEPALLQQVNDLILRRVKPEIEKAFQFSITRFERHLVACYEAHDRGFFNRHRDNTTKGTIHRRFAMSLNLNTGDYEGGCLTFPEYGSQLYRPEVGEAVIFSCSLLHEATPVTRGRRFALLSFFYSDEDAKVREQNRRYVVLNQPTSPKASENRAEPPSQRLRYHASSGEPASTYPEPKLGFQPQQRKRRVKGKG